MIFLGAYRTRFSRTLRSDPQKGEDGRQNLSEQSSMRNALRCAATKAKTFGGEARRKAKRKPGHSPVRFFWMVCATLSIDVGFAIPVSVRRLKSPESYSLRDLWIDLYDHGNFALGQQQNLEHKVISFVSPLGEPRLSHEDETCKQDCFKSHDRIEQGKRCRVEVRHRSDAPCIYEHPNDEENKIDKNESEVAGKARYGVPELISV